MAQTTIVTTPHADTGTIDVQIRPAVYTWLPNTPNAATSLESKGPPVPSVRQNLVQNPSGEDGTLTGWTSLQGTGGTAAFANAAGGLNPGTKRFRLTWSVAPTAGPVGGYYGTANNFVAGDTVAARIERIITTQASRVRVRLSWLDAGGAATGTSVAGDAVNTLANAYQTAVPPVVGVVPAGAVAARVIVEQTSAAGTGVSGGFTLPAVNDVMAWDGLIAEKVPAGTVAAGVGPYFDGSYPGNVVKVTAFDVNGTRTLWTGEASSMAPFTLLDSQPPLRGPVTYTAELAAGPTVVASDGLPPAPGGGSGAWLSVPGEYPISPDVVLDYPADQQNPSTVHLVVGRVDPIVAAFPMRLRTGTLQLLFTSAGAAKACRALYASASAVLGPALLRLPEDPGVNDGLQGEDLVHRAVSVSQALEFPNDRGSVWSVSVEYVEVRN